MVHIIAVVLNTIAVIKKVLLFRIFQMQRMTLLTNSDDDINYNSVAEVCDMYSSVFESTSMDSVFQNDDMAAEAIPSEISSKKPLYSGSDISTSSSICAIMQFALSHQLTDEEIEDLLKIAKVDVAIS